MPPIALMLYAGAFALVFAPAAASAQSPAPGANALLGRGASLVLPAATALPADVAPAEQALLGTETGLHVRFDADDPHRARRGTAEGALLGRRP